MKKLPILTCALLTFISSHSEAQTSFVTTSTPFKRIEATPPGDAAPVVTIGTIESAMTSREKVLAYPRLLAQALNCEVTGFSISITSNNKTWGPVDVKGAAFPEDVRDKIKEADAPPTVKISIDKIMVKCNGGDEVAAKPIVVEYDH